VKWLVVLCVLCACGPEAALYVTVDAPLHVPDACDAVRIIATERGVSLFDQTFSVTDQFPQTLTLTSTERTQVGGDVEVEVKALKSGAPATSWSDATQTATLVSGQLTPVIVSIQAP
jgi:hypothetical protein